MSGKTKSLRASQKCLLLTYTLHRPHFKAIYKHRFPEIGNTYDDVVSQVKKVFKDSLSRSPWTTPEQLKILTSIIDATPLETSSYQNADFSIISYENFSVDSSDFVSNLMLALTNCVRFGSHGWSSLGTLTEHLHAFSLFRQYFRDGIMWPQLDLYNYYDPDHDRDNYDMYYDSDRDFLNYRYSNYLRYGRVGYLIAYEIADALESHLLGAFDSFDENLVKLNGFSTLTDRQSDVNQIYRKIAQDHLSKLYSFGDDNDLILNYGPQSFLRDAVAKSFAIYATHQAFIKAEEQTEVMNVDDDEGDNETVIEKRIESEKIILRLFNLDTYSDERKLFLVMSQMWCERMTSDQFSRSFLNPIHEETEMNFNDGLSGFSGIGLTRSQPGPLTTAVMANFNKAFSTAFSCPSQNQSDKGVFSRASSSLLNLLKSISDQFVS